MPTSKKLLRDLREMVDSSASRSVAGSLKPLSSSSAAQPRPLSHGGPARMMQVPEQKLVQVPMTVPPLFPDTSPSQGIVSRFQPHP